MTVNGRTSIVALLGTTQTLAWASSYYLPAIVAVPIAHELGIRVPTVFAAFSVALIVSAIFGPHAGAAIDRWGGRPVLMVTNLLFAAGLGMLGCAEGVAGVFVAWIMIGAAMGAGLYEAAFATLVRLFGREARGTITGITLIAGFASTVGWPLTSSLVAHVGWRGACFAWAGSHLFIGLPLNAVMPRLAKDSGKVVQVGPTNDEETVTAKWQVTAALSFVFAATWFVSTAMAAHLPRLLEIAGTTTGTAVLVGSLIGPAQVAARVLEFGLLRRVHPLLSARIAALLHPIGAGCLAAFGPGAAIVFGVLHGAGNGILTIAKGTLPLVVFGPRGYGSRQGVLMFPSRLAQAVAPWAFGIALERWGVRALGVTAMLGVAAFLALYIVPAGRRVG